jgi:hypothetical protein
MATIAVLTINTLPLASTFNITIKHDSLASPACGSKTTAAVLGGRSGGRQKRSLACASKFLLFSMTLEFDVPDRTFKGHFGS